MRKNAIERAIEASRGAQPVTITAITQARLCKNHPLAGHVYKKAIVHGWVNLNYQKQLEKFDPGAQSAGRKWGVRNSPTAIISHINKEGQERRYINFTVDHIMEESYIDVNGKPVAISMDDLISPKDTNRPKVRNYDLANIIEVRAHGKTITG